MRTFKFRAWNKKTKELSQEWNPYVSQFLASDIADKILRNNCEEHDYIFMQYTWLKDKNWKEIYEGDIIKVKNDTYKMFRSVGWNKKTDGIFVIVWERSSFMKRDITDVPMEFKNDSYLWLINDYDKKDTLDAEIIGNVHENPELLK